jgi:hypothetical protein
MNKAITSHEVSQSAVSSACCSDWRRRSWTDMGLPSVPSDTARSAAASSPPVGSSGTLGATYLCVASTREVVTHRSCGARLDCASSWTVSKQRSASGLNRILLPFERFASKAAHLLEDSSPLSHGSALTAHKHLPS